jgi:thiamine pyrophosphate-dependent acetolactate synthase large subunit-like protein
VVRIDIDAEQLARRMAPTVAVHGDARRTLTDLAERLAGQVHHGGRGAALAADLRATALGELGTEHRQWVDALAATLTPDTIVALDSTQLAYTAHVALPCARPRSWLAPYGLGTLGCALPMAIGAAIADRARPVVAVAGDGGWLFTVAEMATAVDEGLDLVLVLWDNRGYGQIRQSFDDADAPRMGVDVSSTDPVAIARGFGWSAVSVGSPTALTAALRAAQRAGGAHLVRVEVPGAA